MLLARLEIFEAITEMALQIRETLASFVSEKLRQYHALVPGCQVKEPSILYGFPCFRRGSTGAI